MCTCSHCQSIYRFWLCYLFLLFAVSEVFYYCSWYSPLWWSGDENQLQCTKSNFELLYLLKPRVILGKLMKFPYVHQTGWNLKLIHPLQLFFVSYDTFHGLRQTQLVTYCSKLARLNLFNNCSISNCPTLLLVFIWLSGAVQITKMYYLHQA